MALDIGISVPGEPWPERCFLPDEPRASLEYGGTFEHLYPYFEAVEKQTGQRIDLWGDAIFCGDDIDKLLVILAKAREDSASRQERWTVHTGTQLGNEPRGLYEDVSRTDVLTAVDEFAAVAIRAKEMGYCVELLGD